MRRRWQRSSRAGSAPSTAASSNSCSHHLVDPVACNRLRGLGEGTGREPGRARRASASSRRAPASRASPDSMPAPRGASPSQGAHAAHPEQRETHDHGEMFEAEDRPSLVLPRWPLRRLPCRAGGRLEHLPRALRQQPLLRAAERDGRRCRRSAPMPNASPSSTTASASPSITRRFGRRSDRLRSLALPACARAQARRAPERRTVPRLGPSGRPGAKSAGSLPGTPDGDRQFVAILTAVPEAGLEAVEAACAAALAATPAQRRRCPQPSGPRREPEPPAPDH